MSIAWDYGPVTTIDAWPCLLPHDVLDRIAHHDIGWRLLQEGDLFQVDDVEIVDTTGKVVTFPRGSQQQAMDRSITFGVRQLLCQLNFETRLPRLQ